MYDPRDLHLLTPEARAKSEGFEAHMERFMARNKEKARLANEARAKARGPLPPPPSLQELQEQLEAAKKRHTSLGGSNWQYADSSQNMRPWEHEARKLESTMLDLNRQIKQHKNTGGGYKNGGKIDLKNCSVSTTPKGKRNSDW